MKILVHLLGFLSLIAGPVIIISAIALNPYFIVPGVAVLATGIWAARYADIEKCEVCGKKQKCKTLVDGVQNRKICERCYWVEQERVGVQRESFDCRCQYKLGLQDLELPLPVTRKASINVGNDIISIKAETGQLLLELATAKVKVTAEKAQSLRRMVLVKSVMSGVKLGIIITIIGIVGGIASTGQFDINALMLVGGIVLFSGFFLGFFLQLIMCFFEIWTEFVWFKLTHESGSVIICVPLSQTESLVRRLQGVGLKIDLLGELNDSIKPLSKPDGTLFERCD